MKAKKTTAKNSKATNKQQKKPRKTRVDVADDGSDKLFKLRANKLLSSYPPVNLVRYGIERMAEIFSTSTDEQQKCELARDMEMMAHRAIHELKEMGREMSDGGKERAEAIKRIHLLLERGRLAPDEAFRVSAVHDLALILDEVLEAMAVLAVRRKDFQAVLYLAYHSELGKHRMPKGATKPLAEAIKDDLGGDYWKQWQASVKSRSSRGKKLPRTKLGVWAMRMWKHYEQLKCNVYVDASNCADGYHDIFLLPPQALPIGVELDGEGFLARILVRALEIYGNGEEAHRVLWQELVGDKYKTANGAPDWSEIKNQLRIGIQAA